ncbi:MAG: peptide-methionine (R)-S-oxide reductase, partial [Pseudomonadota bacterium]
MAAHSPARRAFLTKAAFAGSALPVALAAPAVHAATDTFEFEIQRTDAEWQEKLTPEQYEVLRHQATEWPGSSPLSKQYETGAFHCQGCGLHVYD